ncbi:hypothetical protein SLE2022_232610 [Rubroshorea leprosula]
MEMKFHGIDVFLVIYRSLEGSNSETIRKVVARGEGKTPCIFALLFATVEDSSLMQRLSRLISCPSSSTRPLQYHGLKRKIFLRRERIKTSKSSQKPQETMEL